MKKLKSLILLATISSMLYGESITLSQMYSNAEDIKKGKEYLDKNETNLAIAAFDRVLIYDPNNDLAKFYLGKTFAKNKDIKLAKQYFTSITNPTDSMKTYIKNFYKKYPDRHLKFDLFFKAGAIYDSNLNNDTDATDWNIVVDNTTQSVHQNKDTTTGLSIYELLSFSPVYYMQNSNIKNTFTIYNKNIIHNTQKDIQVFNYSPSITQKTSLLNNTFYLNHSLSYSYVRYGNASYLNKFGANEEIKFDFLKNHTSITNLGFYINKYIQNKSLNYYQFNLDSQVIKHLYSFCDISLGVGYEKALQESDNNLPVDYNAYKAKIGSTISVFNYLLDLGVNYEYKKYNDINSYFLTNQTDKKYDYVLSLTSQGFFTYQTKIEYINNDSNIAPYSYDKWLISFNIAKSFKGL